MSSGNMPKGLELFCVWERSPLLDQGLHIVATNRIPVFTTGIFRVTLNPMKYRPYHGIKMRYELQRQSAVALKLVTTVFW